MSATAITPAPSAWPETDEERSSYQDWQYQAQNGYTVLGWRDWVANNAEDDESAELPAADSTTSTQTTSTKPYESIDLAYRQEDEHRTNKPLELSHVEYVKAKTGEMLRVTLENQLYQGGGPDAVVHLLNHNQEWTNLLSVPQQVWWKQFTPGPFQTGATRETNRENMARIADELLLRAVKILSAAAR